MVVESSIPCDSLKALPIELLTPTCMGIVWAFENHPIQIEKFPVLGQSLIHFEKIWVCMGLTFMIQVWVLSTGFKTTKNHHFPCSKIDNLEVYIYYNIYIYSTHSRLKLCTHPHPQEVGKTLITELNVTAVAWKDAVGSLATWQSWHDLACPVGTSKGVPLLQLHLVEKTWWWWISMLPGGFNLTGESYWKQQQATYLSTNM